MPGRFWLPATPDHSQAGTLRIEDGGKVRLELIGRLDIGHPFKVPSEYERVVGEVIEHGPVTLEECHVTAAGYYGSGAPYRHELQPCRAIIGAAYEEKEAMLFDELKFSIEGLDEWLAITGFMVSWFASAEKTLTIKYTPPEKRELWRNDHFSLWCEFNYSAPTAALKNAEVNQLRRADQVIHQHRYIVRLVNIPTLHTPSSQPNKPEQAPGY